MIGGGAVRISECSLLRQILGPNHLVTRFAHMLEESSATPDRKPPTGRREHRTG
jgi:hypothetical protein